MILYMDLRIRSPRDRFLLLDLGLAASALSLASRVLPDRSPRCLVQDGAGLVLPDTADAIDGEGWPTAPPDVLGRAMEHARDRSGQVDGSAGKGRDPGGDSASPVLLLSPARGLATAAGMSAFLEQAAKTPACDKALCVSATPLPGTFHPSMLAYAGPLQRRGRVLRFTRLNRLPPVDSLVSEDGRRILERPSGPGSCFHSPLLRIDWLLALCRDREGIPPVRRGEAPFLLPIPCEPATPREHFAAELARVRLGSEPPAMDGEEPTLS